MNRRLPPLPALRAFEAAARHVSFRRAAEEIHVTPSAVSHQVKALEVHLGTALFLRDPGGLALTEAGQDYLRAVTPLLDGLDAATRRIATRDPDGPLRVLSTPGFAARWLVPRLTRFPGRDRVEMIVSRGAPCTDFATNGADVVIHWGDTPIEGARVIPMMQSGRFPVASSAMIEREQLRRPEDLLRVTLLRDEVLDGWEAWLALAGVAHEPLRHGPRLPHCELSLVAAEQGQGVALTYGAMADLALADGRLTRLFDVETAPITIYSFAYSESRRACPDIRALQDWMFGEIPAETVPSAPRHAAE
ncbi:MAG: LysR family transcriptional regulator [Pseudomonadota bacterium]